MNETLFSAEIGEHNFVHPERARAESLLYSSNKQRISTLVNTREPIPFVVGFFVDLIFLLLNCFITLLAKSTARVDKNFWNALLYARGLTAQCANESIKK